MKNIKKLISFFIIAIILFLLSHHLTNEIENKDIFRNILQGCFASTLVVLVFEFISEYRLYKRLNFLNGEWEECGLNERKINKVLGKGIIKYNGGNSLEIELSHDERKWKGEIIVNKDHPHIGTVSWSYVNDFGQDHEFGLKDIIIPTERNKSDKIYYYFYLLPVNHDIHLEGEIDSTSKIKLSNSSYGKVIWRKKK